MGILKNQRRERFAQLVAQGRTQTEAYMEAYGVDVKRARSGASELFKQPEVQGRVTELQEGCAREAVLSLQAKREFLRKVVLTPAGCVTEESELCEVFEVTERGKKVKLPDKLRALELDAKLAGELREKPRQEGGGDGLLELLQWVRGGRGG